MKTYQCLVCGEVFTVAEGEEPVCPKCRAKGNKLKEIKEETAMNNKYSYRQKTYF